MILIGMKSICFKRWGSSSIDPAKGNSYGVFGIEICQPPDYSGGYAQRTPAEFWSEL
ncbi:hypothetical protein SAMN06265379_108110 [Saccharicrinis carchari]|uniref:Uncharacterized protein n=1 Tax=Saccharicrinis carchari TaxID=1168039 RepID=A0A521EBK5_SACCC|nr:hypothetical protein SAMN06265379_108110 [Saccharicrinis carchari]